MPRHLLAGAITLLLLCSPVRAEEEYSPWRAFAIDEIRLGGMTHNLDVRNHKSGLTYTITREDGVDVNAEVLFATPWRPYENPILDFLLRPRHVLGATVNTQGDTSQVYFGAAWTLPLFNIFFVESMFGGAYHDGPITSPGPRYVEAYGCRVNFHESGSFGVKLGENWRIMATIEHMSNARLCEPNAGLTNAGVRLGYKFNP